MKLLVKAGLLVARTGMASVWVSDPGSLPASAACAEQLQALLP